MTNVLAPTIPGPASLILSKIAILITRTSIPPAIHSRGKAILGNSEDIFVLPVNSEGKKHRPETTDMMIKHHVAGIDIHEIALCEE